MAIDTSSEADLRCTCSHSMNAHGLSGDAGCTFCHCRRFTRPEAGKEPEIQLSKFASSAYELISRSPSMKHIHKDALVAFVKDGHGRMYADGNYLTHRGDRSHTLHVLLSGKVLVEPKAGEGKGHQLGAGEIAGDLRALTEEPRWASIYALESVMALDVDASTLKPTFAAHPEFFSALVQTLGKYSDNMDEIIDATVQAALEQEIVEEAEHQHEGLDPAKALEIAAQWRKMKEGERAAADRAREAAQRAIEGQTRRR